MFKRADKGFDIKLRYLGYCHKCGKETDHRFDGGSLYETRYRCMKCKTINIEIDKI